MAPPTTSDLRPLQQDPGQPFTILRRAASVSDLAARGRLVVRIEGHQIVLFQTKNGIRATNNRCPHEGYPLAEGSLSDECVLTCNWHNWKFDLESGETITGGDRLRSYPVEIRGDEIFIDCAEPPLEQRRSLAWSAVEEAFGEHDYGRMAREIARLRKADVSAEKVAARAFERAFDRLEYGVTHAQAVAADWLALHDRRSAQGASIEEALVPILELVGHLSWDVLRQPRFPYPEGARPWDSNSFVAAIDAEDETAAIQLVRGFLAEHRPYAELEHALARAALAHYQDYGHSAIYVYKTGQLIDRFGPEPWLLFPLVRSLIYATREDQIPEFRAYAPALERWRQTPHGSGRIDGSALYGLSLAKVLDHCLAHDHRDENQRAALFDQLFDAAGWTMLHFDESWMRRTDQPISKNANWLDLTHALTFANAVHRLARRHPDLWPESFLQMGCFVGRLRGIIDASLDTSGWRVDDPESFLKSTEEMLFDHGQPEYIISAHFVKVWCAVDEEVRGREDAPWAPNVLSATRRFFEASHKRKHALRTMRQALTFVRSE
jgi:nitrite reductase/ring-hydroxylating ferredoxin subunit